jgi:hypothetical protein
LLDHSDDLIGARKNARWRFRRPPHQRPLNPNAGYEPEYADHYVNPNADYPQPDNAQPLYVNRNGGYRPQDNAQPRYVNPNYRLPSSRNTSARNTDDRFIGTRAVMMLRMSEPITSSPSGQT